MLTDAEIRNLKPKFGKQYWVVDDSRSRGSGRLRVKVKESGKEFYFTYYRYGKEKSVKLGVYKTKSNGGLTLIQAREKADRCSRLVRDGKDPKDVFKEEQRIEFERRRSHDQRGSFQQLMDSYVSALEHDGKRTHKQVHYNFQHYVSKPFPIMASRKAAEITIADIRDIISRMIKKGITTHCNRLRSQLHAAFVHGLHADNDPMTYLERAVQFNLSSNPVSGIPVQRRWERVGQRTLTANELHHFLRQLPGNKRINGRLVGSMSLMMALYFKLVIASGGQRVEEVARWEWAWIDWNKKIIDIPPHGTKTGGKTGRGHIVPLIKQALDCLSELKPITGHCRYVFAGGRGGGYLDNERISGIAPSQSLRRFYPVYGMDQDNNEVLFEKFTPRDLRRTCKTLMGEAGISKELRDRVQNHAMSDVSTIHYDRYDYLKEKRSAMAIWQDYLEWIICGCKSKTDSNVIRVQFRN